MDVMMLSTEYYSQWVDKTIRNNLLDCAKKININTCFNTWISFQRAEVENNESLQYHPAPHTSRSSMFVPLPPPCNPSEAWDSSVFLPRSHLGFRCSLFCPHSSLFLFVVLHSTLLYFTLLYSTLLYAGRELGDASAPPFSLSLSLSIPPQESSSLVSYPQHAVTIPWLSVVTIHMQDQCLPSLSLSPSPHAHAAARGTTSCHAQALILWFLRVYNLSCDWILAHIRCFMFISSDVSLNNILHPLETTL